MARKEFTQDAAAEMFAYYLKSNNFQPLPPTDGERAIKSILRIDYRPYLRSPDFLNIYKRECVTILVSHGSSPENATIFAEGIVYLANRDNGFGDAMKEFVDRFVTIDTRPPEADDSGKDFLDSYGRIALSGFDPSSHINQDGSFNFQNPPGVGVQYHDPNTGAIISAGASAGLGVFVAVSGPITPAVFVIGAAIVVGAILLKKALKDSC